jgi:hypothetical protein
MLLLLSAQRRKGWFARIAVGCLATPKRHFPLFTSVQPLFLWRICRNIAAAVLAKDRKAV